VQRQTRLVQTVAATRGTLRQHRAPHLVDADTILLHLIAVSEVEEVTQGAARCEEDEEAVAGVGLLLAALPAR
jgi:predicted nucleic acid-binding protein